MCGSRSHGLASTPPAKSNQPQTTGEHAGDAGADDRPGDGTRGDVAAIAGGAAAGAVKLEIVATGIEQSRSGEHLAASAARHCGDRRVLCDVVAAARHADLQEQLASEAGDQI